jgi:hypothetical protein
MFRECGQGIPDGSPILRMVERDVGDDAHIRSDSGDRAIRLVRLHDRRTPSETDAPAKLGSGHAQEHPWVGTEADEGKTDERGHRPLAMSSGDRHRSAASVAHESGQQVGSMVGHSGSLRRSKLRVVRRRDGSRDQPAPFDVAGGVPVDDANPVTVQLAVVADGPTVAAVDIGAGRRGGDGDRPHPTAPHAQDVQAQTGKRWKGIGRWNEEAGAHGRHSRMLDSGIAREPQWPC